MSNTAKSCNLDQPAHAKDDGNEPGVPATAAQDNSTDMKSANSRLDFLSLASFTAGVFHNVGNIVNTLCISAETALEIVEQLDAKGVGEAAKLLGSFDEEMAQHFGDQHPLRLLPSYLTELSRRISDQQTKGIGELQVLIESAEHIRENLRYQQDVFTDNLGDEPLDIGRLIEHALSLQQNVLKREQIRVDVRCEKIPPTRLKRRPLLQVLTNLIVNSKHAMQEIRSERLLSITAGTEGERILIRVTDSGVGILQSDLERIFEREFTTKKEGSGIGLYISRHLVEELGGRLTAQSAGPDKGATFIISLPVIP